MNLMGMSTTGPGRRLRGGETLACLIALVLLASAFWSCASSQSQRKYPLSDLLVNYEQSSQSNPESSGNLESPPFLSSDETPSATEDPVQAETPLVANMWFETDLRQVLMDLSQETEIPIVWKGGA